MQLNSSQLLMWLFAGLFYIWYSTNDKRDKIYCTLIRKDKTKINLWRKKNAWGRVELDGGWFYYTPKTVFYDWLNKGIHMAFPIYIPCVLFRYNSKWALNPETFIADEESPQTRKNLDKEEDLESWRRSGREAMGGKKKTSILEAYMPMITVGGFAVVGYFIYTLMTKVNLIGNGQNAIQNMLGQLLNKVP